MTPEAFHDPHFMVRETEAQGGAGGLQKARTPDSSDASL